MARDRAPRHGNLVYIAPDRFWALVTDAQVRRSPGSARRGRRDGGYLQLGRDGAICETVKCDERASGRVSSPRCAIGFSRDSLALPIWGWWPS